MFAWKNVTYNDDYSLAGAKMLQRYRTNISGSSRKGSLHRLESLFLIDEDDKEDPDEDTLEVEEQVIEVVFKFRETILHHRSCQQVEDEDVFIPPDGGYGWFVALGAFIAFFFSAGIVKSYGVILDSILLEYEGATVSQAAWIPVRQPFPVLEPNLNLNNYVLLR